MIHVQTKAEIENLSTETVEGTSRPLESVDDIEGGDSLSFGMFSVCDRITNDLEKEVSKGQGLAGAKNTHVFQEDLENTTSLFVDETGDTLDTATASKTTDSRFGNALDVVTKDLAVTLGAALSETLEKS